MKLRTKVFYTAVVLTALALLFSACSGGKDKNDSDAVPTASPSAGVSVG